MEGLFSRLARGKAALADGAIGTMLIARGIEPGACLEAIALTDPGALAAIARAYAEAGADLVQANTFGASPAKLAGYGLAGRAEEIVAAAVRAAREGVSGRALVYGSCGPSGRILKPYGDADPVEIRESFERQARALVEAGVDAIVVETMTDVGEAALAVRAAKDASLSLPVVATMTFDRTPRGFFTIMGTDVARASALLEEAGADVLGSNCGNGSDVMVEIAREFRRRTRLPVAIQPNAGIPRAGARGLEYPEGVAYMADRVRVLVEKGVSIVGGCCGTTPDHIRAFRRVIDGSGSPADVS